MNNDVRERVMGKASQMHPANSSRLLPSDSAKARTSLPAEALSSKKRAKGTNKVEKRRFRTRTQCPKNLHDRLRRSVSQRMFLIQRSELANGWRELEDAPSCDFTVAGSTGNIYTVKIDYVPTCTCHDFLRKQDLCKHIFFVFLKCIGVEPDSHLLYQKAFLSDEIRALMVKMEERRTGGTSVEASVAVRAAFQKRAAGQEDANDDDNPDDSSVKRKSLQADADCPICFDPLEGTGGGNLVYCRSACGSNFHADCIQRWLAQASHRNCPNCRQPWVDPNASPKKRHHQEGYLNLSDVTGQSPERDTSTYYSNARRRFRY